MQKNFAAITDASNFFMGYKPAELIRQYGSPLYVYNESIIRTRAREMKNLVSYENFQVNYSAKANSSIAFLKIIRDEGLSVDAMSPGEMYLEGLAGFSSNDILFIANNVSEEEMLYAIERDILISVDSLSQLARYGRLNPGGKVSVRFNGGIGAGHHEKVVTAGKNTKFGINIESADDVKKILKDFNLTLVGINQHIGSLFMDSEPYLDALKVLLPVARQFDRLEFIDIGGGFGIPYHKYAGENRLELRELGEKLSNFMFNFSAEYGKNIMFKIEPGRYISAESSVLLGTVHAAKNNADKKYIGTDLGFNVLIRPVLYDSYHDIEIYRNSGLSEQSGSAVCSNDASDIMQLPISEHTEKVSIVGNICETGDIVAKDRELPEIFENDILGILDAGAYGFAMSSNYNSRLRPAEILIHQNGTVSLIRKRDSFEQLAENQIY